MSGLKGDFIGFTFDNIHSSLLGITRVSEGSRYNEDLLPSIEDKTVRIPGGDGSYYFGSYYINKNFNISIAFDNLSELEFRKLKQHFGQRKMGDLIFDDTPYKIYKVKVSTSPNFQFICFDEEDKIFNEQGDIIGLKRRRVYKGEGTISFTTINTPFARSRFKFLEDYNESTIPEWSISTKIENDISVPELYQQDSISSFLNKDGNKSFFNNKEEWAEASGMKENRIINNRTIDTYENGQILLYNPGDKETDFRLRLEPFTEGTMTLQLGDTPKMKIQGFNLLAEDTYFQINSKTELIEGLNAKKQLTGNIYNKYIIGGSFFKIPQTNDNGIVLTLGTQLKGVEIEYDYLYF